MIMLAGTLVSSKIRFIEPVARRLKIKKKLNKQIMNCTTKQYNTRQEMKCNGKK